MAAWEDGRFPPTHTQLLDVIMHAAGSHWPQSGLRRVPTMSWQLAYQGYHLPK